MNVNVNPCIDIPVHRAPIHEYQITSYMNIKSHRCNAPVTRISANPAYIPMPGTRASIYTRSLYIDIPGTRILIPVYRTPIHGYISGPRATWISVGNSRKIKPTLAIVSYLLHHEVWCTLAIPLSRMYYCHSHNNWGSVSEFSTVFQ